MQILLTLALIPRPVLLVVALGMYGAIVRWRFSAPMLLDALLIGLLIFRPSHGLAAWVGFLLLIRHVPTFAADVVTIARVSQFDGWTAHAILFALPALRVYASAPAQPDKPGAFGATIALPPPIVTAPALAAPPAQSSALLAPVDWLGAVNDDQTAPHLGVVGPTRLGKTTFVLAALSRRAGMMVITTPKSIDADPWGGALAIRLRIDLDARIVDWTPIEGAIDGVHFEMLRRNATNTAKDAPRLNLIVDELSTTLANCARKTKSQILELWNMGAGANINVIVCDPEVNATAWGIQGRRDILGNLVFAQVSPGRRWSMGRIDPNGRLLDPQALDTAPLLRLAGEARLAGREWAGGAASRQPAPPVGVPVPALGVGAVEAGAAVGSLGTGNGTAGNSDQGTPIEVLRILRSSGKTREWARQHGCVFRDSDWTEAGKAAP